MKKGVLTEIDWGYIGATLAQGDDQEQTEFFKAFVKEAKSWGTNYQVELQLANVNAKLTDEEKDSLAMLSYKEE